MKVLPGDGSAIDNSNDNFLRLYQMAVALEHFLFTRNGINAHLTVTYPEKKDTLLFRDYCSAAGDSSMLLFVYSKYNTSGNLLP